MNPLTTSRQIPAPPEAIFAAFSSPERLARWWGPNGFSNTIHVFEFVPGGRWSLTMHAPNGAGYPNECRFSVIEPSARLVIEHISEPRFTLTLTLEATNTGTLLHWEQLFVSDEAAQKLESLAVPANEQNLDHLTAEVLSSASTSPATHAQ